MGDGIAVSIALNTLGVLIISNIKDNSQKCIDEGILRT
jgi:hypothetical protein